jgi:hypothetical protein
MKLLIPSIVLFILLSCSKNDISELDFIIGTWKMEGKEQYEIWEKSKYNEINGYSYKLDDGKKTVTETLSIKKIGNQIIYEATVPTQNKGKTVQFTLNRDNKSCFSFENMEHDFPKKIQYKIISINEIEVSVLGNNSEGFSFTQVKQ